MCLTFYHAFVFDDRFDLYEFNDSQNVAGVLLPSNKRGMPNAKFIRKILKYKTICLKRLIC